MIPSRKEMTAYWFAHPIAGTVIAFAMLEAGKTLWESAVNPKGKSPFSTYFGGSYDPTESYDATDPYDAAEPHTHRTSDLDTIKNLESHHGTHYGNHKLTQAEAPLGTLGARQSPRGAVAPAHTYSDDELNVIAEARTQSKGDTYNQLHEHSEGGWGPGTHNKMNRDLNARMGTHEKRLAKHEKRHRTASRSRSRTSRRGFGSSSTTTSTSSAHGGTIRNPTGSTWDKHKAPGENADMFGMPQKKGTILMGPPSARRRISLNAFTLGGLSQAPQKIGTPEEDGLPQTKHFDILGMMPEQSDDATDNPWV